MRYDLKECGKRIQQFRKERGLTQEQLAEKLNVSQNTIAKIESGLRRPSIDFLLELSEFFGVSTNYLVLGIHPEDMGGSLNEKIDEARKDSIIQKAIEKTFAPEFINRLSKIVIFSNLGTTELQKIIDLELSKLSERLKESKINIKIGKALKEYIISQCNLNFGARDLQRKISEVIEERLCEKLLEPDIPKGKKTFMFDYKNEEVIVELK